MRKAGAATQHCVGRSTVSGGDGLLLALSAPVRTTQVHSAIGVHGARKDAMLSRPTSMQPCVLRYAMDTSNRKLECLVRTHGERAYYRVHM